MSLTSSGLLISMPTITIINDIEVPCDWEVYSPGKAETGTVHPGKDTDPWVPQVAFNKTKLKIRRNGQEYKWEKTLVTAT